MRFGNSRGQCCLSDNNDSAITVENSKLLTESFPIGRHTKIMPKDTYMYIYIRIQNEQVSRDTRGIPPIDTDRSPNSNLSPYRGPRCLSGALASRRRETYVNVGPPRSNSRINAAGDTTSDVSALPKPRRARAVREGSSARARTSCCLSHMSNPAGADG